MSKATKDANVTPKGIITFSKIGSGFGKSNVSTGYSSTFKLKRGKLVAGVSVSDKTFTPFCLSDVQKAKDVTLTGDYKISSDVTVNTKYELGPKKYQLGATWNGRVAGKATTLKTWYTNKDNLAYGEANIAVNKTQKATFNMSQNQLLSAKYTIVQRGFTLEPSYNLVKKAPAISITRKVGKSDTLKLAYDLKSEAATVEFNHRPFKLTLGTSVSTKQKKVAKPTVALTFENTYNF
ncbi:hypothetical protein CEUSTIGMA_g4685.t1 [Chlamydomonas eustigma]|uniref:Uncharacterized protein n=1 Tax=Chlamydomonas eustigma TaxID=1157962 RepID=A0A250X2E1_9CHLO|nr:hypothetical protein CEUSTIGMA_g4685.t1 [Chlamydomonas eustigma]|eukprot:GAX77238.1 hypothetical protein CEUSTIGMA_g4685.t1 [Chlamydomonas eustigma]